MGPPSAGNKVTTIDANHEVVLCLSLQPTREGLAGARSAASEFLAHDLAGDVLTDFVSALNEAVINAISHSGTWHRVWIHLRVTAKRVTAIVLDTGRSFDADVRTLSSSWPPDPMLENGRGLFLMSQLTDCLAVFGDRGGVVMLRLEREAGDKWGSSCGLIPLAGSDARRPPR